MPGLRNLLALAAAATAAISPLPTARALSVRTITQTRHACTTTTPTTPSPRAAAAATVLVTPSPCPGPRIPAWSDRVVSPGAAPFYLEVRPADGGPGPPASWLREDGGTATDCAAAARFSIVAGGLYVGPRRVAAGAGDGTAKFPAAAGGAVAGGFATTCLRLGWRDAAFEGGAALFYRHAGGVVYALFRGPPTLRGGWEEVQLFARPSTAWFLWGFVRAVLTCV